MQARRTAVHKLPEEAPLGMVARRGSHAGAGNAGCFRPDYARMVRGWRALSTCVAEAEAGRRGTKRFPV